MPKKTKKEKASILGSGGAFKAAMLLINRDKQIQAATESKPKKKKK